MRRFGWLWAWLLVGMTAGAAWAADPIVLGKLAALTGSGATWGEHYQNISILAVEEINAKGGLLGRPVELVIYDTKGRPEDTVNAARRMIEKDKVVAIAGTNYSGLQIAIRPLSERAQVPILATSATNPAVTVDAKTGKPYPYSFRICFTDPYQGTIMAEFAYRKLKLAKAAIFHDVGSDYAEGMKQFFVERYAKLGGKVAGTYGYRDGDVDFRAQITNAKVSGAQVVILPGLYKEMALIIKQAAEMGWNPVFIGGDGYSPAMYEIAGAAMEGTYWVSNVDWDDPNLVPFAKAYEKRWGKYPVEMGAAVYSYEATMALLDAAKRAAAANGGKVTGALIAREVVKTKNLKMPDFTYTCDPATHNPLKRPVVILKVKDKKTVMHSRVVPSDL